MTPKTAASLLRVSLCGPWTEDAVRAAFTDIVRKAHPDTGGAGGDLARLKEARDVLLKEAAKEAGIVPCARCEGTGRMTTRSGRRVSCSACGGTGESWDKEIKRG